MTREGGRESAHPWRVRVSEGVSERGREGGR